MPISRRHPFIDNDSIIISLTSFPARINNVWMTCATLLNQDFPNIHIVLWLSREQFPNEFNSLPKKLSKLMEKGLDIRFVDDDIRPHKKYFYAFQDFPNNDVVTVDDDILYNPKLISYLVAFHQKHPKCVICNRGIRINTGSYSSWTYEFETDQERFDTMPTGIGGVYYPAHIFDGTPIFNKEGIKKTCLNGDDLWLNFMSRYSGHKVVYTGFKTGLVTILSSQDTALCNDNLGNNKNDKQIEMLSQWVSYNLNCDYYINVFDHMKE